MQAAAPASHNGGLTAETIHPLPPLPVATAILTIPVAPHLTLHPTHTLPLLPLFNTPQLKSTTTNHTSTGSCLCFCFVQIKLCLHIHSLNNIHYSMCIILLSRLKINTPVLQICGACSDSHSGYLPDTLRYTTSTWLPGPE